jgi:hypothetical protein
MSANIQGHGGRLGTGRQENLLGRMLLAIKQLIYLNKSKSKPKPTIALMFGRDWQLFSIAHPRTWVGTRYSRLSHAFGPPRLVPYS